MICTLPKPPSVNHLYGQASTGRRYIAKEGVAWFDSALKILGRKGLKSSIEAEVEVWIVLNTTRTNQDVDNVLKALLDALSRWCIRCRTKYSSRKPCVCGKNFSVMKNDSQVYKLDIEKVKVKGKENESVEVQIMGY